MKSRIWHGGKSGAPGLIVLLLIFLLAGEAAGAETALILSADNEASQQFAAGFKAGFSSPYKEINLEGSDEKQRTAGEELKAAKPAAAVVVGDLAAQLAKWYLADVPLVYAAAPKARLTLAGTPAAGVHHEPDPQEQLKTLAKIFPDKKNLTLLYCPEHSSLDPAALKQTAAGLGLNLNIASLTAVKDVAGKLKEILPKTQVLWLITDPAVISSHTIQYILLQSLSLGVPIFCGDSVLARGGATAALAPDLNDAGRKAAEQAMGLLGGAAPGSGAVVYPQGNIILNLKTATLLKISFPEALANQAKEVIK